MNILVFNVGSTTLKFACVDPHSGNRLTHGTIDRIGQDGGDAPDHLSAADMAWSRHADLEIAAIGHRLVQGGALFSTPTTVNDQVLAKLAKLDALAPLHNPPARAVLEAMVARAISVPQVLVFDTAYFSTLPEKAFRYAIPDSIYRDHGVRRYGAHGTSHQYVTGVALDYLTKHSQTGRSGAVKEDSDTGRQETMQIISLHLGGGTSITASIGGVAVETSMGMTPLEGLVMATRSGDIDPAVVLYLIRQVGMSVDEVDHLLNKSSGLLGLCGDVDMRTILRRRDAGDRAAALAIDIYVYRLQKYIGAYFAILGGLDAVIFTAGIGENAAAIRQLIMQPLKHLGIEIDPQRNSAPRRGSDVIDLTATDAAVRTLVVPTDEELAIALQVAAIVPGA
jgi:acetate kinase